MNPNPLNKRSSRSYTDSCSDDYVIELPVANIVTSATTTSTTHKTTASTIMVKKQKRKQTKRQMIICGIIIILFVIYYYYLIIGALFNNNGDILLDEETLQNLIPPVPVSLSASVSMAYNVAFGDSDADLNMNKNDDDSGSDDKEASIYLTMYGEHRAAKSLASLPQWFQEYVEFNRNIRKSEEVTATNITSKPNNINAKYLVLMCLPKDTCGGISDRFRGIIFDLFVAKHTNRILCIHWVTPYPLEQFLQPNTIHGIDWRCPSELSTLININQPSRRQRFRQKSLHSHHRWFRCKDTPTLQCTQEGIDKIKQSGVKYFSTDYQSKGIENVNFANLIVQRHSYTGGSGNDGKSNVSFMPEISQWQYPEMIHDIFRVMFQPVPALAQRINHTMAQLHLVEDKYVSVHVRARYPVPELVELTQKEGTTFRGMDATDKGNDVQFVGKTKKYFMSIVDNAIKCGHLLAPDLPLYFASDHHNVTQYAISNFFLNNSKLQPVGLNHDRMPLHTDVKTISSNVTTSKKDKVQDFYNVFEDLLIMGGSKCVAHGVGSFGSFGAGLAGNRCRSVHRKSIGYSVPCPNERGVRKPIAIEANGMLFREVPKSGGGKGKLLFDKYPS